MNFFIRCRSSVEVHVAGYELREAVGDGDDVLPNCSQLHPLAAPEGTGAGHDTAFGVESERNSGMATPEMVSTADCGIPHVPAVRRFPAYRLRLKPSRLSRQGGRKGGKKSDFYTATFLYTILMNESPTWRGHASCERAL
jgi:hypothetical protein